MDFLGKCTYLSETFGYLKKETKGGFNSEIYLQVDCVTYHSFHNKLLKINLALNSRFQLISAEISFQHVQPW